MKVAHVRLLFSGEVSSGHGNAADGPLTCAIACHAENKEWCFVVWVERELEEA